MKVLVFCFLLCNFCYGQHSVVGKWKTIDDHTGKEKSIIVLSERGGKIYGKVIKIFPEPGKNPDPFCSKCPPDDPRFNKKVIGMEIITNLIKSGNAYDNGSILDPEVGKVYKCKIWLEGNDLKVRGYWGMLYRTQTWKRVK